MIWIYTEMHLYIYNCQRSIKQFALEGKKFTSVYFIILTALLDPV